MGVQYNPLAVSSPFTIPINIKISMNNQPASRVFNFRPDAWPDNAIHISLDLETASTAHNAAIVQLAAVVVGTGHVFNEYVSITDCESFGMDVSVETMMWWNKQDPTLRERVFGGTNSISDTVTAFLDWCQALCEGDWNRIYLWGNGVDFDVTILTNAIEIFGKSPFNYRNIDHLRTIKRAVPVYVQEDAHDAFIDACSVLECKYQPHDAVGDALYQAYLIQHALQYLKDQDVPPKIL